MALRASRMLLARGSHALGARATGAVCASDAAESSSLSDLMIKLSGYRKYGLKAEDLIMEEVDGVQEALRRMPQEYNDERFFRLKRAMSLSLQKAKLPADEQTNDSTDTQELVQMINEVRAENAERAAYDE